MALKLQVVVGSHCSNCDTARSLADDLCKAFPRLTVQVIDLDAPGAIPPAAVFAVPTYLLDDQILWLGNPDSAAAVEELKELLHEH